MTPDSRPFHKKILICLLLLAIPMGGYLFLYSNDAVVFDAFNKIDDTFFPYQRPLARLRHLTGRILDEMNPLFNEKNILSKLDVYELILSPQDIQHFSVLSKEAQRGWNKPSQDFRKIELRYRGRRYPASMKLHGDTAIHWQDRKKSFQIKLREDAVIHHKSRLLFILPEPRKYLMPLFASHVAKQIGLPYVENSFVAVKMNNIFQGIYYMEEHVDAKFLEAKGISNGVLIELSDNWVDDRRDAGGDTSRYYGGITFDDHHDTPFNLEISDVKEMKSPHKQIIYNKANGLFKSVRRRDLAVFESLMDIPRIGAADAWRTVMGDRHSLVGDNARIVYLLTSGQFFFVPRNEGACGILEYQRGSFENWLNTKTRILPFWEMSLRSDRIRAERNKWLYHFVIHEKEFLAEYDALRKKYEPLLKQDTTLKHTSRELHHQIQQDRRLIKENLARLKAQFAYHKVYVNAIVNGNSIELDIIPDTSMQSLRLDKLRFSWPDLTEPLQVERIQIDQYNEKLGDYVTIREGSVKANADLSTFFNGKEFSFDFDESLKPKPIRYRFRLVFEDRDLLVIDKVEVGMSASVSGERLEPGDIYAAVAQTTGDRSAMRFSSKERFMGQYPELQWDVQANRLTLKPGSYTTRQNVIIPEGLEVVIGPAVEWALSPGTSVLSYSPVNIMGTAEAPVVIKGLDPEKPFGAFAVVGHENRSKCVVKYLDISHGSEAVINGMFFSGALCFYHSDVVMDHVRVHDNHADDGLNIKYGNVLIENSDFIENKADQIDLDFCNGFVRQSRFAGAQDDDNGDGLDLSGSRLVISGSSFQNFLDKGISIGEDSTILVLHNTFTRNAKGSTVKDMSRAFFYQNEFVDNQVAVSAYRKKPIFGGGNIYFYHNSESGNKKLFEYDENSIVYQPTKAGESYLSRINWESSSLQLDDIFSEGYWKARQ